MRARAPENLEEIWSMFTATVLNKLNPQLVAKMKVIYYMGARDACVLRADGQNPYREAQAFLLTSEIFDKMLEGSSDDHQY